MLICPECGSDKLLVYEQTSFWLNTGEYFCNSVKSHDPGAEVNCQDTSCEWRGFRYQLNEVNNERN